MKPPVTRLLVAALGTSIVIAVVGAARAPAARSFRHITFSTGMGAGFVAVADVNEDGKPDLIVANDEEGTLTVLLGTERGTFVHRPARLSLRDTFRTI